MSVNNFAIIQAPVVTERSTNLKSDFNQYVFKVNPNTTKGQIKAAIEKIYNVNVEKVRTSTYAGKLRRLAQGRPQGRRAEWKKAIVTVQKGQEIKIEQETGK